MSPEGHGLIMPTGQSFVPAALQSSPSNPLPFTRRATMPMSSSAGIAGSGYLDICTRMGFTLPVTPTRCRFRIRNSNLLASTTTSESCQITGVWWGTPNSAAENSWSGDFTATPTLVDSGTTQDLATEYVGAWFTPPTSAKVGAFQGVSFGFLFGADSKCNFTSGPGWTWRSATNVGLASTSAAASAAPSAGTAAPYLTVLDIRLEYEFVSRNQIGFFIGDSLTYGYLQTIGTQVAYGHMGPDNSWPVMAGNRIGHCAINGGVGGTSASPNWNVSSNLCWTRFNDPTTGTLFGATTPDYAVIALGFNDTFSQNSLSTFQGAIQTIIGTLNAAGIGRIVLCTATAGFLTEYFGALATFQTGVLNAALTAGSGKTAINVQQIVTTAGSPAQTWPSAPGGGPAVAPVGSWYDAGISGTPQVWLELPSSGIAEGPFTVTAASGTNPLALTISSSTFANAHKLGAPVLSAREGYRQNYNHWMRQLPPGVIATIDMAKVSETSGAPPIYKNWYYYAQQDDPHPNTPALYNAMAQEFTAGLIGL